MTKEDQICEWIDDNAHYQQDEDQNLWMIEGDVVSLVHDAIEEFTKPKWIPVGERLPTKEDINSYGEVFVQSKYNGFMVIDWEDLHDKDYTELYNFIAWQPLTEPYKP